MAAPSYTPRRDAGLAAYEHVLARAGLAPVAGIDEAGRGACAGPLVVAAVVLDKAAIKRIGPRRLQAAHPRRPRGGLRRASSGTRSTGTSPRSRTPRSTPSGCTCATSRACAARARDCAGGPAYVLTDGFPVQGLGAPALAMWKGDRVAASVAAASIVAKVTRDRMMRELDERYPVYGFCRHKGYVTGEHLRALAEHGPSPVHRRSFRCVPVDGRGRENRCHERGRPGEVRSGDGAAALP